MRGEVRPKELAHAELMTEWVQRLDPDATEAQLLAARAHHLRRWTSPRSSYPEGRAGYLRWRTALKKQHAEEVAGHPRRRRLRRRHDRARCSASSRRQGLGTDPAVQVHEDALCLVFLETQLAATVDQLGDEHMLDVIRKTAAKMSPAGLAEVAAIPMRDHDRDADRPGARRLSASRRRRSG